MSDPYFLLQCHLFLPGGGVGVVGVVGGVGPGGGVGVPQWLCARPEVGFLARWEKYCYGVGHLIQNTTNAWRSR